MIKCIEWKINKINLINLDKSANKKACFEKSLIKTRFFYIQLNHPFIKNFDDFWGTFSIKATDCGRSLPILY